MGASSSSAQKDDSEQREIQELEATISAFGNLSILRKAFENMAGPDKTTIPFEALQECLHINFDKVGSKNISNSEELSKLLEEAASKLTSIHFLPENGQISWLSFLKGYASCCKPNTSDSVYTLVKFFHELSKTSKILVDLELKDGDNEVKVTGFFTKDNIYTFLWFCWLLEHSVLSPDVIVTELPDIEPIVNSANLHCSVSNVKEKDRENKVEMSSSHFQVSAENFISWILNAIPGVSHSLMKYVQGAFQRTAMNPKNTSSQSPKKEKCSSSSEIQRGLLTDGIAWALAVSFKRLLGRNVPVEPLWLAGHSNVIPDLLYRSSYHGKGMNRFWSHIEGYHGPMLILLHGKLKQEENGATTSNDLMIAALTGQEFENRDVFYGSYGVLYALKPIFRSFFPAGQDKNFVYSHLHAVGRVYEPYPKPVGLAFGGTQGHERIFIDEDFGDITLRHHATDKTYQSGFFFHGQPYLPVQASITEVEAWGLGGKAAMEKQAMFQQREKIFAEQRRKVDLKTFATWEDSPEKMMLDIMSNPYKVEREDR